MNFLHHSAIFRTFRSMTVIALTTLILTATSSHAMRPDTTWSVYFRLNMSGAIKQQLFRPDSDYVYVVPDHGIEAMRLVAEPGNIYTGMMYNALDSGVTYSFKFRINDNLAEAVNRTIASQPGMATYNAWWNNQPINTATFSVNMTYAAEGGLFNPATDSVTIVGTMNNMQGSSRMQRVDTSLNYIYIDTLLDPGSVQEYKYRINQSITELDGKPNRMVRIPDTTVAFNNDFNNINPHKVPVTLRCNMGYYMTANHFDPAADYLDVAGNFNNQGANDVLFDADGDSVYTTDLFLEPFTVPTATMFFKFRINGDWSSAELAGKPDRKYILHDTTGLNPNLFSCYYNDLDPAVPTPPWVYNVNIQGLLIYKKFLSGTYSYENVNGIAEGISAYRWLRSDNAQGANAVAIDSATRISYVVDTLDIGKWLVFEITPKAVSGDSATGLPVRVVSSTPVSAWDVGIGEINRIDVMVYPNPVSDMIRIRTDRKVSRLVLFNSLPRPVIRLEQLNSDQITLGADDLPAGIYFLMVSDKVGRTGFCKIIRL